FKTVRAAPASSYTIFALDGAAPASDHSTTPTVGICALSSFLPTANAQVGAALPHPTAPPNTSAARRACRRGTVLIRPRLLQRRRRPVDRRHEVQIELGRVRLDRDVRRGRRPLEVAVDERLGAGGLH